MIVVQVALENTTYQFDKPFTYIVPAHLDEKAKLGCRVLVPFGNGNQKRQGMILEKGNCESDIKLKMIEAVLDKAPLLSHEQIKLAVWLKANTFCTLFDAVKLMIPAGVQYKIINKYIANRDISPEVYEELSSEETQIIEYLMHQKQPSAKKKIYSALGFTDSSQYLENLSRKGFVFLTEDTSRNIGDATIKMVRLKTPAEEIKIKLTLKQKSVCNFLEEVRTASVKEVCYFTGVTQIVLTNLEKSGILEFYLQEYYRNPYETQGTPVRQEIFLSQEQIQAYDKVMAGYHSKKAGVSLLYGVTGSGKTSVFMKIIEDVLEDEKGVLVMVPEISLTPQTIEIFQQRYGNKVAVFHSSLSLGERLDEWKRVKRGDATIVIGTRSAVFAPLDNIGVIIIDEEQQSTYKSESNPRYDAKEVAKFRCVQNNAQLLLCSATPSLESYYYAQKNRYSLLELTQRYGPAKLPEVTVVDMNDELLEGNISVFSSTLINKIENVLNDNKQVILLLNRRGYNTIAICRSCKTVLSCPNCSIAMTYHSANNRLMCHYCGYTTPFKEECPECHEKKVQYTGFGTQKAQEELDSIFPSARILRIDADTTMSKFSLDEKLKKFADKEYDIMIGTQMVAKGLNFPNVTLVGVLSADQSLYSVDFRAYERTFSLLTQVVGRSGRGDFPGEAIIQTYTPENPIIRLAAEQDYKSFYDDEIQMRKAMLYPPFVDICYIGFSSIKENLVKEASDYFFNIFCTTINQEYSDLAVIVLGPAKAMMYKINNKYRYKMIIKCKNTKRFRDMISKIMKLYYKNNNFKLVSAYIDINPDYLN